jgi:hypothetical protein
MDSKYRISMEQTNNGRRIIFQQNTFARHQMRKVHIDVMKILFRIEMQTINICRTGPLEREIVECTRITIINRQFRQNAHTFLNADGRGDFI